MWEHERDDKLFKTFSEGAVKFSVWAEPADSQNYNVNTNAVTLT